MPILNYTTEVAADRTVNQILALLSKGGARSIMANYGPGGKAEAISFSVDTPMGLRTFALPIDPAKVLVVLRRDQVPPRYRTPEQAERVAWRIVKDWLEAQLAIIATEMVTLDQVMLPYMHVEGSTTVYQALVDQQLALGAGDPGDDVVDGELVDEPRRWP